MPVIHSSFGKRGGNEPRASDEQLDYLGDMIGEMVKLAAEHHPSLAQRLRAAHEEAVRLQAQRTRKP